MEPVTIGLICIAVLIVVMLLGMPVGFTMGLIGMIGFAAIKGADAGMYILARDFWDIWASYNLTVIPMFVFMGSVAFHAGMSGRLYDGAYTIFGRLRGGLALATVVATAGFAAICGSTNATAAAMGKVAIPEMRKYGYNLSLATGCMAASGSLGIMIPPSTVFIVYSLLTEQSVGKLFIAGVVPGLVLAFLFCLTVYVWCRLSPTSGPAGGTTTLKQKVRGLTGLMEIAVLFALVLGGLFSGLFSPTQAAGVGTAAAIVIGVVRRSFDLRKLWLSLLDTGVISAMVMTILAAATVFGHFMAISGIPRSASDFLNGLPVPDMVVMILILAIYLVLGMFMDGLAMVTLTVPILYPTIVAMGFDPVWFGVIIVLVAEMGVVTPPVGMNVYIIKGVTTDISLGTIFKGSSLFLIAMFVLATLLLLFPALATWLPGLISY
jgi:C4-dicarboxylate transporter DctM subunit